MSLVWMMLLVGAVTWCAGVMATTWVLLRPTRLTPARAMARLGRMTPADLGLHFADWRIEVRDTRRPSRRLAIAAWWIEAQTPSDKAVIIVHGYADSRAGALAWAPIWRELGWNLLLVDLRAHGESEGSSTTAGLLERGDLEQVANDLRARAPDSTRQLAFFGVSMGAAVALAAAERCPGLAGVVIDSPVVDFDHGAATQLSLMGLAGGVILKPGLRLVEMILGAKFASIRPAEMISRLTCPVLALLPGDDPFLPAADADKLRQIIDLRRKAGGADEAVDFPGAWHLSALGSDPMKYRNALNRFARAGTSDGLARASTEGVAEQAANAQV